MRRLTAADLAKAIGPSGRTITGELAALTARAERAEGENVRLRAELEAFGEFAADVAANGSRDALRSALAAIAQDAADALAKGGL